MRGVRHGKPGIRYIRYNLAFVFDRQARRACKPL